MTYIKQVQVGGYDKNLSYIIADEETKKAVLIDPVNVKMLLNILTVHEFELDAVLITHEHHDHIEGIPDVLKYKKVPIYAHEITLNEIKKFTKRRLVPINDRDNIHVDGMSFRVMHTPGHSPGSLCFWMPEQNVLFTGDTLFVESCGRCDFPTSDIHKFYTTLTKSFKDFSDSCVIYPGHDYGPKPFSTLGEERQNNPFLNCKTKRQLIDKCLWQRQS